MKTGSAKNARTDRLARPPAIPRRKGAGPDGRTPTLHLTVEERQVRGRAQREQTPRSSHATRDAAPDRPDPVSLLEAQAPVLEPHLTKSVYQHQGQRVVAGQMLMQSASDIFLGWMSGPAGRHFYRRQLRDMKGSAELETFSASDLALYGTVCGWALARAHARAGDPVEIAAYLGTSDTFDKAIASLAEVYANETERDYKTLLAAIKTGRIVAATTG